METSSISKGILDGDKSTREHIVGLLTKAYWMEIETVMSYLSASTNLDGVRAQEISESLAEDIEEELGHAEPVRRADQGALRRRPRLRSLRGRAELPAAARASRPTWST